MKQKMVLLLMATLMFAFNTEAQTASVKLQFAKWNAVPAATDAQIIAYTKMAMKGEAIQGVTLRAKPENYKAVFGSNNYDVVINAPDKDFTVGPSNGNENNWGIDASNGSSIVTGTLAAGVKIVYYKGIPIAKWGTNGCINALSLPQNATVDPVDQDNIGYHPNPNGKLNNQPNGNVNTNTNTNTFSNPNGNNGTDMLSFYNGMMVRENHMLTDFNAAKDLINSRPPCNTCPQGNTVSVVQPNLYSAPQPNLYASNTSYNPGQQMNGNVNLSGTVTVKEKVNWAEGVNTGLNAINTGLNIYNTFKKQPAYNSSYSNGGWGYTPTSGYYFNDGNQLGNVVGNNTSTGYNNTWTGNTLGVSRTLGF